MNPLGNSVRSAKLHAENLVDSACDAFEEAWRLGRRPRIEDFLRETLHSDRSTLLRELVRVEAYYRTRNGESPQLGEYLQRFPGDAETLNDRALADAWSTSFSTPEAAASPRSIATYELLEMLGEGASGCVWKARDRTLDRICALKLPRSAGLSDAEAAAFLREAQAAAQLRHPNIVTVFGVEHDGRTAYIISEYIAGLNLKDWLKQNRPTFAVAARLCVKLAEALQHAHDAGIVHRDLKPANIVLDPEGEPHITDFGLAKRLSGDGTVSGQHILGTPGYMSPEQAAGNSKHVDGRTDVYSLGIILYELLTGQRAFDGDPQAALRRVLTDEPPPPRAIRGDIPRDLETICLKATAREREQRYVSASELAADLNRFLNREPVKARKPRSKASGRGWSRRQFTTAALAAVPFVGYGLWAGVRDRRQGLYRPVTMKTVPAGAEIYFIPLNKFTGEPEPARIIHAGRSPVELELPPGEYLVEAILDEQRFHEVYRRVPDPAQAFHGGFSHQFARSDGDGSLELLKIHIPPATVTAGMARIKGHPQFAMGLPDSTLLPRHFRSVPAFYMDPYEVTCGEYRKLLDGRVPPNLTAENYPDRHAMPLTFDMALTTAEYLGKRLPDEVEYEFAATAGGARETPGEASPGNQTSASASFGSVDGCPRDRVDLDPKTPIYGLCSNVAEWTINWASSNPGLTLTVAAIPHESPGDFRVVRGGNEEVIQGSVHLENGPRDARERYICWRYSPKIPGLGLRCVRSRRPRLSVADFVRTIEGKQLGANQLYSKAARGK